MRATMTSKGSATATWTLQVSLRRTVDGPEVAREPVHAADLAAARGEAWLAGWLRKGYPTVSLQDVPTQLIPIRETDSPSCVGFALEATHPGGEIIRQEFSVSSLQHVASRAYRRLIAEGVLQAEDLYYYRLLAETSPPGRAPDPAGAAGPDGPVTTSDPAASPPFTMAARSEPLVLLKVPLEPLLRLSDPVGDQAGEQVGAREQAKSSPEGELPSAAASDPYGTVARRDRRIQNPFPVFYTELAFTRAERFSRLGAAADPPLETGAILVGSLCCCPETGEFFAVVHDALEARDTEQTAGSLLYTGKSWQRIQKVMRARQSTPDGRSQRILGQAHGHNFLPSVAPACQECPKLAVCELTSVFASVDDLRWSRAVFSQQPWHLCHIFGLSARNEPAHGLFGLSGGALVQRGFHLISDFDPGAWPLAEDGFRPARGPTSQQTEEG